jgi:hypothetical protein
MPVQTTKKTHITFPDGAMVQVNDGSGYFDVGAIQSAVTQTLNYTENQIEGANWGKSDLQIKEMTIAGGFTLVNLDTEGVEKLGAGMFERVDTSGGAETDIADQVFAQADWAFETAYPIVAENNDVADANYKVQYRLAAPPTLTSVDGSTDTGLVLNDDYFILTDTDSPSGYSIMFSSVGTKISVTGLAQSVTIDFTTVTPIDSRVLYAGTSTKILTAYSMKVTHTDSNGKIRQIELFAVNPNSGSFQFNFKGANEDGLEEMPLTYTAQLDTSLTDGRQLMAWTVETGAQ